MYVFGSMSVVDGLVARRVYIVASEIYSVSILEYKLIIYNIVYFICI